MSQDFSKVLNAQIADLKEEMGIIDPSESSVEPVQEVVEEVKVEPVRTHSKETGKKVKMPVRRQIKEQKTITSFPIPKAAKIKVEANKTAFGDALSEMFAPEERIEITEKVNKFAPKKQRVVEDSDDATVARASQILSKHMEKEDNKIVEELITTDMLVEKRIAQMQMQLNSVMSSVRGISESTLVSGIGQGGDGQTPGSGEVQLKRLDDVSINNISDGDTLIWDSVSNGFVPGAGGGGGGAVDRLIAGIGIDVTPAGGIGIVEIELDANLDQLNDVDAGTPTNGDLLVYSGSKWSVGAINTSQVALKNATRLAGTYNRLTPGSYTTQEEANILFANEIDDVIIRLEQIEGTTKPGHYLGQLDCTVAANEPGDDDKLNMDPGDYFLHSGPTGDLWNVGPEIQDGYSVVWNGAGWEVVSSSNTLAALGDTNINNAINQQMLVYDEVSERWENESVDIPNVTIGNDLPNTGLEKNGDIHYKEDTSELFVYNNVWEKVAGGGGSVKIDANPPADANEGDLWVETDNWTINVYDGFNWVGLTNSGLINGVDPADLVTNTDLNATIDTIEFQINQNAQNEQVSLLAAINALDTTHLRMEPQGPLTGPLTLSDDGITAAKQAIHKEYVEGNFLNLNPQSPLTGPLTLESDLFFDTDANKAITVKNSKSLKIRGGDTSGSNRTFIDIQNYDNSGEDGADDGYRMKLYHVADPTVSHHAATKKYVDDQVGGVGGIPVGCVMMWINSVAPAGWFKLKGGTFDIATYPLLHAYLENSPGSSYSSGVLPDWRGRYPGQLGDHMNGDVGSKHDQRTAKPSGGSPKSSHQFNNGSRDTANKAGGTNFADIPTQQVVIDTGWDDVTRPPSVAVHFIIKHD